MSVMTDAAPHGTRTWAPGRFLQAQPEQVAHYRVPMMGLTRSDSIQILPARVILAGGALRLPIWVDVTAVDGGGVGVVHSETGVFGFGSTLAGAVTDLRAALVDHRDVLLELEQAEPGERDQLEQLQQLLLTA